MLVEFSCLTQFSLQWEDRTSEAPPSAEFLFFEVLNFFCELPLSQTRNKYMYQNYIQRKSCPLQKLYVFFGLMEFGYFSAHCAVS